MDHRRAAQLGYMTIDLDCRQAKSCRTDFPDDPSQWVTTLVFDHEKKRPTPNLVTKETRFKHQLSVYNLDFYVAHEEKHHFFCGVNGMEEEELMN